MRKFGRVVSFSIRNWVIWVRLFFYSTLLVAIYMLVQIHLVFSKPNLEELGAIEAHEDLENGVLCLRLSTLEISDHDSSYFTIEKEFSKYLEEKSRIQVKDVGFLCGCNKETYKTKTYNSVMIAQIIQEYGDGFLSTAMLRVLIEIKDNDPYARIEHATPGLPEVTNLYKTEEELDYILSNHTTSRWR